MKLRDLYLLACAASMPAVAAQSVLYDYTGMADGDGFGFGFALVGDLNTDGFDDFVVGVPGRSATFMRAGQIRAYSGRNGAFLYARDGAETNSTFGVKISALGDVNGDAVPDYVVQSKRSAPNGPHTDDVVIQVLSGVDGAILHSQAYDANQGLPNSISPLADVNQDSVPDFIVGSGAFPGASGNFPGRCQVRSGADGSILREQVGIDDFEAFGLSVQGLDDVNGDGVGDYAVGAPGRVAGPMRSGTVIVYSGSDGTEIYQRSGPSEGFILGRSMVGMGDLNQDGIGELVVSGVGVVGTTLANGAVLVLSGMDGSVLLQVDGALNEYLGYSIADVGDFNDDGKPDFAVATVDASAGTGRLSVRSGQDGAEIAAAVGSTMGGAFAGNIFGGADLDGDGFPDVVSSGAGGSPGRGRLTVFKRDVPNGGTLCKGLPNSTGQRAILTAMSPSGYAALANDLNLVVTQLPTNSMGYFIVSSAANIVPGAGGSSGRLCIASHQFGRYSGVVLNSGLTGSVSFAPDTTTIPVGSAMGIAFQAVVPGAVFNFQYWYRHANSQGGTTSNFSDAVTTRFH